jgi:hypothetical protein
MNHPPDVSLFGLNRDKLIAMREALRAYLRFAGAGSLEWAAHLGREKRLFLARP